MYILDEYPDEVSHIFRPSCVLLSRCGGCCGDEGLHCVPIKTANITMQVGKLFPHVTAYSQPTPYPDAHRISRNYPDRDRGRPGAYNGNQTLNP